MVPYVHCTTFLRKKTRSARAPLPPFLPPTDLRFSTSCASFCCLPPPAARCLLFFCCRNSCLTPRRRHTISGYFPARTSSSSRTVLSASTAMTAAARCTPGLVTASERPMNTTKIRLARPKPTLPCSVEARPGWRRLPYCVAPASTTSRAYVERYKTRRMVCMRGALHVVAWGCYQAESWTVLIAVYFVDNADVK